MDNIEPGDPNDVSLSSRNELKVCEVSSSKSIDIAMVQDTIEDDGSKTVLGTDKKPHNQVLQTYLAQIKLARPLYSGKYR
jgi:hypothetical protein